MDEINPKFIRVALAAASVGQLMSPPGIIRHEPPSTTRKKPANAKKKAARKRQRKARQITRRNAR